MNESSISIFIVQAALALFTFFVAAPCVLNAISTFTVQALSLIHISEPTRPY